MSSGRSDFESLGTNAQLVAENIAQQLERRIAFRRPLARAMQTALKFGAKGTRVAASGRLAGAEMSRRETYRRCTPCARTSTTASPRPTRPPARAA